MNRGVLMLAGALTLAGCADDAPVAPVAASVVGGATYEISFHTSYSYWEPVTSVPVGTEVAVRATVRDGAGALATTGSVTFERCTVDGSGAPSLACDAGPGTWKRLMSMRMDESGFPPTVHGGRCSSPRTIGFRYKYTGTRQIPSGMSASKDVSWVAKS